MPLALKLVLAALVFAGLPGPVMFYGVKKFFESCFSPETAFAATISSFCLVTMAGVLLLILYRALTARNPLVFSATEFSCGERQEKGGETLFSDVVFSSPRRTLRIKLMSSVWPSFDKALETGQPVEVGVMYGGARDVPHLVAVSGSRTSKRNEKLALPLYKKVRFRLILLLIPSLVILPLATSFIALTVVELLTASRPATFWTELYKVAQHVGELHSGGAMMAFTGLFFYAWAVILIVWRVRMRRRFERLFVAALK